MACVRRRRLEYVLSVLPTWPSPKDSSKLVLMRSSASVSKNCQPVVQRPARASHSGSLVIFALRDPRSGACISLPSRLD
jgi:hypothetical protein